MKNLIATFWLLLSTQAFAGQGTVMRTAELVSKGKTIGVFEIVASKKINNQETTILKAEDFQALNELASPGDVLQTSDAELVLESTDGAVGTYSNAKEGTVGVLSSETDGTLGVYKSEPSGTVGAY